MCKIIKLLKASFSNPIHKARVALESGGGSTTLYKALILTGLMEDGKYYTEKELSSLSKNVPLSPAVCERIGWHLILSGLGDKSENDKGTRTWAYISNK
jgi:hypothetical protein